MILNKVEIKKRYTICGSRLLSRFLLKGYSVRDYSLSDFILPFDINEVACIYEYHIEKGAGSWFELNDGSIWNDVGLQENNDANGKFI